MYLQVSVEQKGAGQWRIRARPGDVEGMANLKLNQSGMLSWGRARPPWIGAEMSKTTDEQNHTGRGRGQIKRGRKLEVTSHCVLISVTDTLNSVPPYLCSVHTSPTSCTRSVPVAFEMASPPETFSSFNPFCRATRLIFQKHNAHSAGFLWTDRQWFPKTDSTSREPESFTQCLSASAFVSRCFRFSFIFLETSVEIHCFTLLFFPLGIIMLNIECWHWEYIYSFISGVVAYQSTTDFSLRSIRSILLLWRPLTLSVNNPFDNTEFALLILPWSHTRWYWRFHKDRDDALLTSASPHNA